MNPLTQMLIEAATSVDAEAISLRECHSLQGEFDSPEVRAIYERDKELAARLRASALKAETAAFIKDIPAEVRRARSKFPGSTLSMCALMEEVGELAEAMLDKPASEVRAEALQVAAMAVRIATEGDPAAEPHREARGLDPVRLPDWLELGGEA